MWEGSQGGPLHTKQAPKRLPLFNCFNLFKRLTEDKDDSWIAGAPCMEQQRSMDSMVQVEGLGVLSEHSKDETTGQRASHM